MNNTCANCRHHKTVQVIINATKHERCFRHATPGDLWGVACDLETMHPGPANAPWCGPSRKFHEARNAT